MKLTTGQTLQNDKYVLNAILSQGGVGTTYRATHTDLAQTVVIKTPNNSCSQAGVSQFRQQFIAEARLLARFHHPNIVRVSDFFEEGGLPFIVMDYIPGRTLAEIISDYPLTEVQAVCYIRQLGAALDVIHQHGLLHRDVKPQNIILRQGTQSVVLIDFGIARELTPGVTQANTGWLSAGYAPIEQYLPQYRWTPATDVYALAATLYALLTGQPPVASVLRDRIPLLAPRQFQPHLSLAVEQTILQGMALEAYHRPQKVADWLALLPYKPGKESSRQTSTSSSFPSPMVTLASRSNTGGDSLLPVDLSPGSKLRSTTATLNPKSVSSTTTGKLQRMHSSSQHSLPRSLVITSVIAAIIGGGFGLALRLRGTTRPGFSPVQINQSFPPKEMPGTPMPVASPMPLPEDIPIEEAPVEDQSLEFSKEVITPPSDALSEATPQPEIVIPSPPEDFSPTSVVPTPPDPEPSTSISPVPESTVDLYTPDTEAPASSEPTPPVSLPAEQVPEIPDL